MIKALATEESLRIEYDQSIVCDVCKDVRNVLVHVHVLSLLPLLSSFYQLYHTMYLITCTCTV